MLNKFDGDGTLKRANKIKLKKCARKRRYKKVIYVSLESGKKCN